jgi:hypothetical protein
MNEIERCQPLADIPDLAVTALHREGGIHTVLHPTVMMMTDTTALLMCHIEDVVTLEFRIETQENEAMSEGLLEDLPPDIAKMSFTGPTIGDVTTLQIRPHHLDTQMNEDDGTKAEVGIDTNRKKRKWKSWNGGFWH